MLQERKTVDFYMGISSNSQPNEQRKSNNVKENFIPQPNGIYLRYARMGQHLKINQCNQSIKSGH